MIKTEDQDNRDALEDIRHGLQQNQRQMAALMGVPLRTYEDLEAGRSTVRPIHLSAARYAAILVAATKPANISIPAEVSDAISTAYDHLFGGRKA